MYMSTSSMKKVSAAAVAAVLGFSAMSRAATLPYNTGFEPAPMTDSDGQSYIPGTLIGQGASAGGSGWQAAPGSSATANVVIAPAAIDGAQSVTLTTNNSGSESTAYSDFINTSLAGGSPVNDGSNPSVNMAGSPLAGGPDTFSVSFKMNTALGSSTSNEAGAEIFNESGNVLASLFAVYSPTSGTETIQVFDGANGGLMNSSIQAAGDGITGTYTLSLDLADNTFTVSDSATGQTSAAFELGSTAYMNGTYDGLIGGISLATIDNGGGVSSATFDDLSVVPEPASFAMVGLGGLLLLAKRPKKRLA
jgi:hypothetical protein